MGTPNGRDNMNKQNISFGIILIVIGILWILGNLGITTFNFRYIVDTIVEFWPLILIIIGINIIFKNEIFNNVLWIIFFIFVLVYSSFIQNNPNYTQDLQGEDTSLELEEEIDRGELNLDLGAASFEIGRENDQYAVIKHTGEFLYKVKNKDNKKILKLENKKGINLRNRFSKLLVGLNNNISWKIDINSGASRGVLDLEDIIVEELDIETGAQSMEIILGDKSPTTNIDIEAGASKIDLNLPSNSGLRVKLEGALNTTNLDDLNLISDGQYYISEGFEESKNKYYLDIEMGVGSLNINYYER